MPQLCSSLQRPRVSPAIKADLSCILLLVAHICLRVSRLPGAPDWISSLPAMQNPPQGESSSQRNKLHKRPPPPQPQTQHAHHTLRRTPSAPLRSRATSDASAQSRSQQQQHDPHHHRSPTSPSSAGSSSHTSIDATIAAATPRAAYQGPSDTPYRLEAPYTVSDKDRTDLFGERFDFAAILSNLNAVAYPTDPPPPLPQLSPQLRPQHSDGAFLPAPHPLYHANSESRVALANPNVCLSQSLAATGRQMDEITQPRGDLGARSPRQRLSDEAKEGKLRKKSGFSSFMNNLVGSPRKPTISAPENPVHVTHVGYDQETGEFTVCQSDSTTRWLVVRVYSNSYNNRAYPKNGSAPSKLTASRRKSRRRTRKPSSTSSHSGTITLEKTVTATTGHFTNSTMHDPKNPRCSNFHHKAVCRPSVSPRTRSAKHR